MENKGVALAVTFGMDIILSRGEGCTIDAGTKPPLFFSSFFFTIHRRVFVWLAPSVAVCRDECVVLCFGPVRVYKQKKRPVGRKSEDRIVAQKVDNN